MEIKQITSDLLVRLNLALASGSHFSQNLEKALELLGEISHHDRIHIIEVHHNMTYTITHSWNERSQKTIPKEFMHNKLIYAPSLERQLCTDSYMIIRESDVDTHPELATLLQALNCRQMLLLPLFGSGSKYAFMAFVQCSEKHDWTVGEIKVLGDLAAIIAVQMDNHEMLKQISMRYKQEREIRLELEIRQNRLRHWLSETRPVWEQMKNKLEQPEIPEVISMEQHFASLDKICSTPSAK